jgi:tetratricopeptide (TPR) repeat protein
MNATMLRAGISALICSTVLFVNPPSLHAQTAADLIEAGQVHDNKLEAKQALTYYLAAEKLQPNNADLLVCIARQYRHLMADSSSTGEKLRLGTVALQYGQRAAKIAPRNSDAQLSTAISYGKMLPYQSSKEQLQCSKLIKEGAERAIKLNPRNDLAWHIIGRWHRNVADISGIKKALASLIYEKLPEATNEAAIASLEKAMAINPNRLMHYIELGRAHAQAGNKEEARKYLSKGLRMPVVEKDDAEAKTAGRTVLASL